MSCQFVYKNLSSKSKSDCLFKHHYKFRLKQTNRCMQYIHFKSSQKIQTSDFNCLPKGDFDFVEHTTVHYEQVPIQIAIYNFGKYQVCQLLWSLQGAVFIFSQLIKVEKVKAFVDSLRRTSHFAESVQALRDQ